MSTDPTVKELLERNKQHAASTSPLPYFSELPSVGLTPPHLLILTCADPRCIPEQFLKLGPADCGSLAFTDEQVRETLRQRQPDEEKSIASMKFGTIKDLEQSVRDDLAVIKGSPLVRKELADRSYGFIYDIKSGVVSRLGE